MTDSKIKINLESLQARKEWVRHKVKEGNNVFRVLPPFGETSNGYMYKKWQIIWGLKDPQSGRIRPFASSMTSEKRCPVTEYVKLLKDKSETLKSELISSGLSEEVVKEKLANLSSLINDLSPKTVYIYNAIDKAGTVGLLELKSTAHKKMKVEMTQYIQDYNQDPTSLNSAADDSGVWFNVVRSGVGFDTEYDVKKCQKKVKTDAGLSFVDDRDPLPSVVEGFDKMAYDLATIYQVKSYDELETILEANLPDIFEFCPEANLTGKLVTPKTAALPPVSTSASTTLHKTGTKPVNVKFDKDEDDVPVTKSTINATADSDLMAQFNDLLNS